MGIGSVCSGNDVLGGKTMSEQHGIRALHPGLLIGMLLVFLAIFCMVEAAAAAGRGNHARSDWYIMVAFVITLLTSSGTLLLSKLSRPRDI